MTPNTDDLVADLRRILGDGSSIVTQHISCNPQWAGLATSVLGLHTQLVLELWKAPIGRSQAADLVGFGILVQTYNLMVEVLSTGHRGLFDATSYLLRALHDAPGVFYVLGVDDAAVEQFLAGEEVRGFRGRKAMFGYLKEAGLEDVAERMSRQWDERSGSLNKISHLSLNQVDRVFSEGPGGLTTLLGGRVDCDQLRSLLQVAIDADCEFMIAVYAVYTVWRSRLSGAWPTAIKGLGDRARSLYGTA